MIGVTCQDKTKRLNCSISIINIDEWMKNIGVGQVLVVQGWVCKMLIFGVYSSWSVMLSNNRCIYKQSTPLLCSVEE